MIDEEVRVDLNRSAKKYSFLETILRIVWATIRPLFRYSPRFFFGWRSALLKIMGAEIGKNVHVYNSATIYMPWNLKIGDFSSVGEDVLIYNLGKITIGTKATISHRAHLCAGTHDYNNPILPLIKPPIVIKNQAWICADSFIGPGVTIGEGAIAGARSVVTKDVDPWTIVAGNPAKFIKKRKLKNE